MKRKQVISGAMIAAASVSASTDRVAVAKPVAQDAVPIVSEAGLNVDTVKVDEDVLRLGVLAEESGWFGTHDEFGGFQADKGQDYLAQTVYGGGDPDKPISNSTTIYGSQNGLKSTTIYGSQNGLIAKVPGTRRIVVINPKNRQATTILYNAKTRAYFNPQTGKLMSPPKWMRVQVEK